MDDKDFFEEWISSVGRMILGMAIVILMLLMVICCGGCTRRMYVPVETDRVEHRLETSDRVAVRIDSVWLRDSITVLMKGDTVLKTVWRDRWRSRTLTDTLTVVRIDSVAIDRPVPIPQEVYVEKSLTWWQRVSIWTGRLAIALLSGWIIIKIVLWRYRAKS